MDFSSVWTWLLILYVLNHLHVSRKLDKANRKVRELEALHRTQGAELRSMQIARETLEDRHRTLVNEAMPNMLAGVATIHTNRPSHRDEFLGRIIGGDPRYTVLWDHRASNHLIQITTTVDKTPRFIVNDLRAMLAQPDDGSLRERLVTALTQQSLYNTGVQRGGDVSQLESQGGSRVRRYLLDGIDTFDAYYREHIEPLATSTASDDPLVTSGRRVRSIRMD